MKERIVKMSWSVLTMCLIVWAYHTTCGAETTKPDVPIPVEWIKTEIYFGRNLPGGQQISQWTWADFMDKVLTKHFPKGLTVYDAYGQMQHGDGRIEKQSTWVVVLLHPKDPVIDQTIQGIVNIFRKQFNKAQVTHISVPVITAKFYAD